MAGRRGRRTRRPRPARSAARHGGSRRPAPRPAAPTRAAPALRRRGPGSRGRGRSRSRPTPSRIVVVRSTSAPSATISGASSSTNRAPSPTVTSSSSSVRSGPGSAIVAAIGSTSSVPDSTTISTRSWSPASGPACERSSVIRPGREDARRDPLAAPQRREPGLSGRDRGGDPGTPSIEECRWPWSRNASSLPRTQSATGRGVLAQRDRGDRQPVAALGRLAHHPLDVGADERREVGLVDHQQVGAGDARAALARDVVAGRRRR